MFDVMKECPFCHLSMFHMDLKSHIGVEHFGLAPDPIQTRTDEQRQPTRIDEPRQPIKNEKPKQKRKNYRCKSCFNEVFESKRMLIIHQKVLHSQQFSCHQCGKTMTSRGYLQNHLRLKHPKSKKTLSQTVSAKSKVDSIKRGEKIAKRVPTLVLNKLTDEDIAKHQNTFVETNEDVDLSHKCKECNTMFSTKSSLNKHAKHIHSGERQSNMKTVQDQLDPNLLEFSDESNDEPEAKEASKHDNLNNDMRQVPEVIDQDPDCIMNIAQDQVNQLQSNPLEFNDNDLKQEPIDKVIDDKVNDDDILMPIIKTEFSMVGEQDKESLKEDLIDQEPNEPKAKIVCKPCKQMFDSDLSLDEHLKAVHQVTYYRCQVCSKVFFTKMEFLGHDDCIEPETLTILDEKVKYLCDKCGKDFKDEQSCKIHTILSH